MSRWHNPSPFSPSRGGRARSTGTSMCTGPTVSSSIRGRKCSSPAGEDTGLRPPGGAGAPPPLRDTRDRSPSHGTALRMARYTAMRGGGRVPARRGRDSPDKDRLNIDKLLNTVGGEFATIATLFDTAKRQAWIGFHKGVDKATAGLQFMGGNVLTFGHILREDCRAQAKHGIVGHADSFLLVLDGNNRRHGSKQLIIVGRHAFGDISEHGRWVVGARALRHHPA